MAKKMLIDATHAEETRVVVVDGNKVEEFDFETINKRQLAGNIYLAKVTRVEPSLQAAFVDYGGNRHGFLAFAEIHPDYYQIPTADRQALIEEERAYAEAEAAEENTRSRRRSPKPQARAERAAPADAVTRSEDIPGMGVVDTEGEAEAPQASVDVSADHDHDHAHEGHDHDHDHAGDVADTRDHTGGDDEIESIADEDVSEEINVARKPRPRRYKIQEVIKVRQIMLVQVVKEERGNKGAALTTYLSLAGRYCVLMPNTARGGGISRKITNVADRKKLKEIAGEMEVPQGAGLIIRTAGSQRTRTEIRRDYEYLMRLWEQIRDLTLRSIAPAPIYEEGDLIKRSIRDLYSKEIDEVLVEGERGYRAAKDFMRMIMPTHAKAVVHYREQLPLFARFQVESYLASMFNPVVQLKSGGYIVIGVTEALVAIDVNSGRATKEGSIEDTATKTNLEAAEEVARQLRLRDLAGLIVIDFIDMEERKNNTAVEKRLKDKLKTDRARIQVGRISGFGLMEMSRQRLRPGMIESTTQPCSHCHGTGLIRSDDSMALQILRQIEEEGTRKRSREVLVKAPVAVANYLMNAKREHIAGIEARYGMSVRLEADPLLVSPDFSMEKFKTATRNVPEVSASVVSVDARLMAEIDDEVDPDIEDEIEEVEEAEVVEDTTAAAAPAAATIGEEGPKKKKRRRRRKKKSNGENGAADLDQDGDDSDADGDEDDSDAEGDEGVSQPLAAVAETAVAEAVVVADVAAPAAPETAVAAQAVVTEAVADSSAPEAVAEVAAEPAAPVKATRSRSTRSKAAKAAAEAAPVAEAAPAAEAEAAAPAPKKTTRTRVKKTPEVGEAAPAKSSSTRKTASSTRAPSTRSRAKKVVAAEAEAPVTEAAVTEAPVTKPAVVTPVAEAPASAAVQEAPAAVAPASAAPKADAETLVAEAPRAAPAAAPASAEADDGSKPKKRGWWSTGR
ncbi:Rne/Rng family ribonuclease [Phaeovulum sp. W22_SRMD_FR3]|uniref:Rne/Rng family ribonuclease n=1 Tax=Phaeovulum sp. W22_SRMD_FR3 TaxID=3240274 RepID=UPI003F9864DA